MVQSNSHPDVELEKLTRHTQQSAPEKNNIGNLIAAGVIKTQTNNSV